MRIQSLACKDFKSFIDATYTFGDHVTIHGENGEGKTSIAEGIVFALFGTTLTGSPFTDGLIRKGAKKCEVTVTFDIGGSVYEVSRTKGKASELYLDGRKATQDDIAKLVGTKDRFLTVFTPGYFTGLADKDAREMLMDLIKPPTKAEVVSKLSKPEHTLLQHESLRDPDVRAKELRSEIKETDAEIHRLEGRLSILKEQAASEIPELRVFDDTELLACKAQLDAASQDTASRIRELKSQLASLGREYETLKKSLQSLPIAPYAAGDPCPVCAQTLTEDALTHTLAAHQRQVAEIEQRNAQTKVKAKALLETGNAIRAEHDRLVDTYVESDVSALKAKIADLESQRQDVLLHNAQVTRMQTEQRVAREQMEQVVQDIAQYQHDNEVAAQTIQAIGAYRAQLAQMQVDQLKPYLNRVDIELFSVVKSTGEVKPTFVVTYDGKEFKRLSNSERIRCNLELATLFNRVLGDDVPVYLDNAESITHFDRPAATQLFTASVSAGQTLMVSNEGEVKEEVAS